MRNDYLWDPENAERSADPSATEVARLERLLHCNRAPSPEALPFPDSAWENAGLQSSRFNAWREYVAIAAVLLLAIGGAWLSLRKPRIAGGGEWQVARISGQPRIGADLVGQNFRLRAGQTLETDEVSRARIDVGNIGVVEVDSSSRVRLLEAEPDSGSLGLDEGTIKALIWAQPRRFRVQTNSATAIDLGCEYTLHVDAEGNGWMRVTIGWVAFEKNRRESFVPVDAMVFIRRDVGPGTPFYEDAPETFRKALQEIDFAAPGPSNERSAALATLLGQARTRDAITLWHLLARISGQDLAHVFDRLAELVPPPSDVTREGILARDGHMRDLWWDALGLRDTGWWRDWKRDFPSR